MQNSRIGCHHQPGSERGPIAITYHISVTFKVHNNWHKFKQQHSKSSSCSSSQIMQPPTVHRPCNASFTGRHCISSQTNPQTFKVKSPKSTTCQNASILKRQTTNLGAAAGNPNTTLPVGRLPGIMDIKPLISASVSACFFFNFSSC